MRKQVIFELSAFEDLRNWAKLDREIYRKIVALVKLIANPSAQADLQATPLKRELEGYWSLKIHNEHRLVYKKTQNNIIIVACKYHYFC